MFSKSLIPALFLAISAAALAQDAVTSVQPGSEAAPTPDTSMIAPRAIPVETPPPPAPAVTLPATPQEPTPAPQIMPQAPLATPAPDVITPSWDTQKEARTYIFQIPAPRGQITDCNGRPLAQTKVSYNLALDFPVSPQMSDQEALRFAHEQFDLARSLLEKEITVPDEVILKHYHNRGLLPMDIASDLQPSETAIIKQQAPEHLTLHPVYQRFYPNGALAGQILGYTGRSGRPPEGPVQDNELLWPAIEGREGIEQTFNAQLTGRNGQMNVAFDKNGRKASEKIVIPPQPGANVVMTLDADIQRITEEALDKGAKRGAIVLVDATTGDIVAMASTPSYNPNTFSADYKALEADPSVPLLPRAYRSAYPPGSTFKVPVGIAALESGAIKLNDEFSGPPSIEIGRIVFHNWKRSDAGMLDFVGALTQSCDTWFYQVGIKTGADPIIQWAQKMGFGQKTGIPLASEAEGRVPTQEYMKKVYGRKFLDGDVANFSIGQGDLLVTPLQMAEAMAAVGNGGTLYRARLVKQVQTFNNQIVNAYNVEVKNNLNIDPKILDAVRRGMIAVVSSPSGTAGRAAIDEVKIAGKTGTAQWGPKSKQRDAAWFVGFCPADKPKYAFAAVYEGEIGESSHGGTYAAPMIAQIMKQLFKQDAKAKKQTHPRHHVKAPAQTETND
ncbi:MAG TPA: penicillin-binding protein 2 [Chthoniobacteraceae bacterium]|jgi:penicillin-binding protein 2|nr:penicillin-binding protein 2 [Chthoniobacteraceae bacterium]